MNPIGAVVITSIALGALAWIIVMHCNLKFFVMAILIALGAVLLVLSLVTINGVMERHPILFLIVLSILTIVAITVIGMWPKKDSEEDRDARCNAFLLAESEIFYRTYGTVPNKDKVLRTNVDYELYEYLRGFTLEQLAEMWPAYCREDSE